MIPFLSDLGGADGSPAGPASPAPRRSVTGAALAAPSVAAGGDRARKVLDGLRGRDRQWWGGVEGGLGLAPMIQLDFGLLIVGKIMSHCKFSS
uniref:Uncharacterized protein n=1 Tax=Oryza punctata TaxID=4537 RepID=A0A0E0KH55_ORYPU